MWACTSCPALLVRECTTLKHYRQIDRWRPSIHNVPTYWGRGIVMMIFSDNLISMFHSKSSVYIVCMCMCFVLCQAHQVSMQRMQDIVERREASLQYYHDQYHSSLPAPQPHPASASSSASPVVNSRHRYADVGEDEIDSGVAASDFDEVDSVQNCLTRTQLK